MTKFSIVLIYLLSISVSSCGSGKGKGVKLTPNPNTGTWVPPVMGPEVDGQLKAGDMFLALPSFLKGQFETYEYWAHAVVDVELVNGEGQKRTAELRSDAQVGWCTPNIESHFFDEILLPPAENAHLSDKYNVHQVRSWSSERENFEGILHFAKRYKSEGDTIYRLYALIVNKKLGECIIWKFKLTPTGSAADAQFIEGSEAYKELISSIAANWQSFGADFEEGWQ